MTESVWDLFLTDSNTNLNKKYPSLYPFLKQLRFVSADKEKIVLNCINPGLKIFIEKKLSLIEEELKKYTQKKTTIKLIVSPVKKQVKEAPLLSFQLTTEDLLIKSGFSRRYSFDNFAVSSTNQVAYAAAQAVADNLGTAYNPLFLYGGVGVGKTHLAQATGRKTIEKDSTKKIYFSPGDLFTNELIEAIREKKTALFRKKYRRLDLLVVDDIQFIAGKQSVQEEFFHTFNSVVSFGGQVILTSDRPPTEIKNLQDRLRSRFSGGLTVDIQPPDFELRTAILLIKANEKNIDIEIEAAKTIAEKINDTRALEGTLLSIYAKTFGKKEKIDIEAVNEFFSIKTKNNIKRISPNDVLRAVSSYYNINISKIKGDGKEAEIVLPRQITMFILRSYLKLKFKQVAFFLNKKDHTTVIHAVNKISRLLAKDPLLKQDFDRIIASLNLST